MKLTMLWVWPVSFLVGLTKPEPICSLQKSLDDPNQQRSQVFFYGQDPGITARIFLARTFWILGEIEHVETLALETIGLARSWEHPFTLVLP
ncbi:MAG: hypothetical protein IPP22_16500 [Nitrosomonas sp.]|nr:hypothetical protein [Nitrosomonas sp.]